MNATKLQLEYPLGFDSALCGLGEDTPPATVAPTLPVKPAKPVLYKGKKLTPEQQAANRQAQIDYNNAMAKYQRDLVIYKQWLADQKKQAAAQKQADAKAARDKAAADKKELALAKINAQIASDYAKYGYYDNQQLPAGYYLNSEGVATPLPPDPYANYSGLPMVSPYQPDIYASLLDPYANTGYDYYGTGAPPLSPDVTVLPADSYYEEYGQYPAQLPQTYAQPADAWYDTGYSGDAGAYSDSIYGGFDDGGWGTDAGIYGALAGLGDTIPAPRHFPTPPPRPAVKTDSAKALGLLGLGILALMYMSPKRRGVR